MSTDPGPTHRLRKLWLSISWLLVALVIYLSLVSGPLPIHAIASDKSTHWLIYGIAHILAYGTLMLWFLQLCPVSRRPIIALGLVALGILLELLQGLTPDRSPGYLDIVANMAGVMLGWLLGKTRLSRALEAVDKTLSRLSA